MASRCFSNGFSRLDIYFNLAANFSQGSRRRTTRPKNYLRTMLIRPMAAFIPVPLRLLQSVRRTQLHPKQSSRSNYMLLIQTQLSTLLYHPLRQQPQIRLGELNKKLRARSLKNSRLDCGELWRAESLMRSTKFSRR